MTMDPAEMVDQVGETRVDNPPPLHQPEELEPSTTVPTNDTTVTTETTTTTTTAMASATETTPDPVEVSATGDGGPSPQILHISIDTRRKEWVCSPIERNEVIHAINKDHEEDVFKTVRRIGRFGSGLYQVKSSDYARYIGKSIELRGILIPLTHFYATRRNDRSNGSTFRTRNGGRRVGQS